MIVKKEIMFLGISDNSYVFEDTKISRYKLNVYDLEENTPYSINIYDNEQNQELIRKLRSLNCNDIINADLSFTLYKDNLFRLGIVEVE